MMFELIEMCYYTGDLEHQFTILREQLYQERIKQIDMNLNDVRNGRSLEYMEPLKQLTETMKNRIEVAEVLQRYRMENINHKFWAEDQGAHQHFEVELKVITISSSFFFIHKFCVRSITE